jgi:hypothetical protein
MFEIWPFVVGVFSGVLLTLAFAGAYPFTEKRRQMIISTLSDCLHSRFGECWAAKDDETVSIGVVVAAATCAVGTALGAPFTTLFIVLMVGLVVRALAFSGHNARSYFQKKTRRTLFEDAFPIKSPTTGMPPSQSSQSNRTLEHERQQVLKLLCAVHCTNNLLQLRAEKRLTQKFFDQKADELHEQQKGIDEGWFSNLVNPFRDFFGRGNYDVTVLEAILKDKGFEVTYAKQGKDGKLADVDLTAHFAVICNCKHRLCCGMIGGRHWYTLRPFQRQWYNLDSKLLVPVPFASEAGVHEHLKTLFNDEGGTVLLVNRSEMSAEKGDATSESAAGITSAQGSASPDIIPEQNLDVGKHDLLDEKALDEKALEAREAREAPDEKYLYRVSVASPLPFRSAYANIYEKLSANDCVCIVVSYGHRIGIECVLERAGLMRHVDRICTPNYWKLEVSRLTV